MNCRLSITLTQIKKEKNLQYSVVFRFTLVSRGLLARAVRAVHNLFDDLSTSSGLSTKTKRFGILHSFSQLHSARYIPRRFASRYIQHYSPPLWGKQLYITRAGQLKQDPLVWFLCWVNKLVLTLAVCFCNTQMPDNRQLKCDFS